MCEWSNQTIFDALFAIMAKTLGRLIYSPFEDHVLKSPMRYKNSIQGDPDVQM